MQLPCKWSIQLQYPVLNCFVWWSHAWAWPNQYSPYVFGKSCCIAAYLAGQLFKHSNVHAASVRPRSRELDSYNSLPASRVLRSGTAANYSKQGGQAMQSMQMTSPASTFRDLYPTSSAEYGSRTYLNPITGQPSAGSVYTRSTSATRRQQDLTSRLETIPLQKSSTSSLAKLGQYSQGLRSMSVDRRAGQPSSSASAAHTTCQASKPHTTSQLPQNCPVSGAHDKYSRPSKLAIADNSSSSSSSSSAASEASSPAGITPPGRRSYTGKSSSASLAAGIRSLSMQLSSPSLSQGTPSNASYQSSSADAALSR